MTTRTKERFPQAAILADYLRDFARSMEGFDGDAAALDLDERAVVARAREVTLQSQQQSPVQKSPGTDHGSPASTRITPPGALVRYTRWPGSLVVVLFRHARAFFVARVLLW